MFKPRFVAAAKVMFSHEELVEIYAGKNLTVGCFYPIEGWDWMVSLCVDGSVHAEIGTPMPNEPQPTYSLHYEIYHSYETYAYAHKEAMCNDPKHPGHLIVALAKETNFESSAIP